MWLIALFGLLMIAVSLVILFKPVYFSFKTIEFSHQKWFHPFEISSRILFGIILVYFAEQTLHPTLFGYLGYIIMAVGVGLLFTPVTLHQKYARYWAAKVSWLKVPAILGIAFGMFVIFSALAGTFGWA